MSYKYIDFFSGAGGLSLGFKGAGGELIFSNELDKAAVATQKRNLKFLKEDPGKVVSCSIEKLHKRIIDKEIEFEPQSEIIIDNGVNKLYYKNAATEEDKRIDVLKEIKDVDLIIGGPPCQGFSSAGRGKKSVIANN